MALAMKATVTTMSSNPWVRSRLTTRSIIGMFAIGSIGLGWLEVSGRSRVPSPPAMITAFISSLPSSRHLRLVHVIFGIAQRSGVPATPIGERLAGHGHIGGGGHPGQSEADHADDPGHRPDDLLPAGRPVAHQEQWIGGHQREGTGLA